MEWFVLFAILLLAIPLDLYLTRGKQKLSMRYYTGMVLAYVALAAVFGGYVFWLFGAGAAAEYYTAYVLEMALSFDNIFVIATIMAAFQITSAQVQRRLLFLGILGAIGFRALFLIAGISAISQFAWLLPAMGILLFIIGIKIGAEKQIEALGDSVRDRFGLKKHEDPLVVRLLRKAGLPLFAGALIAVEVTDLIFAIDSIPVVLAVTQDPFIALAATMLAVMGLRSMFFLLQGAKDKFEHLSTALGIVLMLIGIKLVLLLVGVHLPILLTLGATLGIIGAGIGASLLSSRRKGKPAADGPESIEAH